GTAFAASYPMPFTSNTAIVVGANAAPSDNIAASSIASNLDASSAGTGATTVTTDGESYKVEKTSTKFHIGDNLNTIISTLDEDELPTLLAEGKYVDNDNEEFDYTQKIELNASVLSMFEDNDYIDNEPTVGFRIASAQNVLNYTITFSDTPTIDDLTTTNLPIMGKTYYVLSNSTSGANLILTLLDSATDTILAEGESTTLNVEGTSYVASINYIGSAEVKLTVNGETTNSLAEGETYKLSDGTYIGIKDIMYSSKDTGISKVEFSVGSGKLKLTSGSEIQINDVAVSGVSATLTNGTAPLNTATATLTSIELAWAADDDLFITEDTEIIMPGFEVVKLSYGGVTYPTEEVIEIVQGSDTYAVLNDFPLKSTTADIEFLYGNSTNGVGFIGIGKDANNRLITSNTTTITFDKDTDAYFIVSYAATTEGESYLMRATNFVDDNTVNKTTIQYLNDGVWTDKKTAGKDTDTFSMGSAELGIGRVDRLGKNVVITANDSATNFYHLYSKEGLRTYLPFETVNDTAVPGAINFTAGALSTTGHNNASFYLNFTEEDKDGNIGSGGNFAVVVGWDSSTVNEVEVSDLIGENVTAIEIQSTDVWRSFMYSALATEFLWDKPTSGQDSIKIVYHGSEVTADVYITSPEVTLIPGGASVGVMTVKDTEVASVSGKNLVVVGGSAINAVAAELLGGAYSEAAFTSATGVAAGEFMIKSFSRAGKTALLVAGYNAADTEKAVTYLLNNVVDTTVGKNYKGTSATEASLVVA
ncbi:MAG: hypothetical protein ABIH79_01330, partial [archaeon]